MRELGQAIEDRRNVGQDLVEIAGAFGGKAVLDGEIEGAEKAAGPVVDVADQDGFVVQAQLAPGDDFDGFVERAEAAGEGDEGVREIETCGVCGCACCP